MIDTKDYFTQFFLRIPFEPGWEVKDVKDILAALTYKRLSLAPEWYQSATSEARENRLLEEWLEDIFGTEDVCVETRLCAGGIEIYSPYRGSITAVAHAIHMSMKHADYDGCLGFQFAMTCSHPEEGEFYGGAAFITKDGFKEYLPLTWLADQSREHEAAKTPIPGNMDRSAEPTVPPVESRKENRPCH